MDDPEAHDVLEAIDDLRQEHLSLAFGQCRFHSHVLLQRALVAVFHDDVEVIECFLHVQDGHHVGAADGLHDLDLVEDLLVG